MTSNERDHNTSSENEEDKYVIFPKFNLTYVTSCDGVLRTLQMIAGLLAFICIQVSVTCFYKYNKQICEGPNIHVFRFFSAISLIVFLLVVFFHSLYVYSINIVCPHLPWQKMNFYLNIACAILTFFAAAILAGSAQGYNVAIAAAFFSFSSFLLFTYQIVKDILSPGERKALRKINSRDDAISCSSGSGAGVEFNVHSDTNNENQAQPCLLSSITRKTSDISFREKCQSTGSVSANDALSDRLSTSSSGRSHSEGRLVFLNMDENFKNSISEISDKRSWVITNSLRGSDITNSAVDNMSNGTYTVEVENSEN